MTSYNLEKEFLNKSNCGTGIVYNKETEQFDVSLDIKTEHLIKVTWKELVDLKEQSALEPGVFYRITDYEFTSTDPEIINAGHRFDIIVLALSENILSEDARAIQHEFTEEEKQIYSEEEQHYFDTSNLAAWKLKYSLDGGSKRFSWAPSNMGYGIVIQAQNIGNISLYRNESKDEQGYFAFSNDNYTYYTREEEPTEDSEVYTLNNGSIYNVEQYRIWYGWKELLVPSQSQSLISYYYHYGILEDGTCQLIQSDSYYLEGDCTIAGNTITYQGGPYSDSNYNYYQNYIVLNPSYTCIDQDGNTITGVLVATNQIRVQWQYNSGNCYNIDMRPIDFYSWENSKTGYIYDNNGNSGEYTLTLLKEPEVGDYIEVTINGDSYTPTNYSTGPWAIQKVDAIKNTKIISTIPKNTTYRGTIYGMVDEYENDCEYDFKNALITGKYSLFDPDQFYYTFTNQGFGYVKLKDGDTPVLLNPGTYTFLGCMPFRLYEEPNYITYVQPIITDEGYDSWDFYAALTDEEELDPETGETLYKVDMFVMPGYYDGTDIFSSPHQHLIKVFEDKKWYVKELIPDSNFASDRIYIQVFSKDSNGNIIVYETTVYNGYTEVFGHYLRKKKAWIYDACFNDNVLFQDFINLNIYGNDADGFDIVEGQDNYASNITYSYGYGEIKFVTDSSGCYGVYYQYDAKPYTIKWLKQGLPISVEGDGTEFATYEGTNVKFTNTITITEPMYMYIKDSKISDSYLLDAYVAGDIVLSSDESLEIGQTVYDLYTTARDGEFYEYVANIVTPQDTSCAYSYSGPDCYRVTLRNSWFGGAWKEIPKVVMDGVRFSTIEAGRAFLQDCYCVKARNGYHWELSDQLFLKNVCFSNLQDADGCIIEGCYFITMEASEDCTIKDCSNTHIFNTHHSNITSVSDSILENVNNGNLCHIGKSRVTNDSYSNICGVFESNIFDSYSIQVVNNNSYGNVGQWSNNYRWIYINGLSDKNIVLSDMLGNNYTYQSYPSQCIHIRSAEDLTITV